MVDHLSKKLIDEVKEAFTKFDKDGDGCICTNEIGALLRSLGKNPTDEEIQDLLNEMDDCYAAIDFPDFLILFSKVKDKFLQKLTKNNNIDK